MVNKNLNEALKELYVEEKRKELTSSKVKKIIRGHPYCEVCFNCCVPILQIHHILPLSLYGDNDEDNILCLCPNCHKKLHALYNSVLDKTSRKEFDYVLQTIEAFTSKDEVSRLSKIFNTFLSYFVDGTDEYKKRCSIVNSFAKEKLYIQRRMPQ